METTEHSPQSEAKATSFFRMVDVGGKPDTRRRAVARGTICLSREAFVAIREGTNPKGNVLALAEVAGIQAVKRVPESIPLCHSLPIEYARLRFEFSEADSKVTVFCEVGTTGKTGVEMEAIAGVNGALLSIYDLSKAVNPVISMTGIRLDLKEGGKSGRWTHPEFLEEAPGLPSAKRQSNLNGILSSVLVVSDRCARGEAKDSSGVRLEEYLRAQGSPFLRKTIVPDEVENIQSAVIRMIGEGSRIIFVSGGTGASPRDVTPEALDSLWTRRLPGIGELLRSTGARHTPMSWISRSEAGLVGKTLVILIPGSENAARGAIETLDPILSHLMHVMKGNDHEKV